jgi:hypothetical protein
LVSLTLHMSSHLWWVHAHYYPQLVERWTYVSSPLLYSHPHRSRTGTTGWGAWRMLWWAREWSRSSSPVNYGCWVVVFVWCNYLTILYRTSLYINDVTFVSVPWVILAHLVNFAPEFWTPKTRVWQSPCGGHEKADRDEPSDPWRPSLIGRSLLK